MSYNSSTITLENALTPDSTATELVNQYLDWESRKQTWVSEKAEVQQYIFATDTTKTTNAKLPWKNKTTVPKLCQIRDNLYANYMAALFPKRKWLEWEGNSADDQTKEKAEAIENLMQNVIERPEFRNEVGKLVLDYIDTGNVFATVEWLDESYILPDGASQKVGYTGPIPRRISPFDIVFNPAAPSFNRTGKFVRTLMTFGDFAKQLEAQTPPDNIETVKQIFEYMSTLRNCAHSGNVGGTDLVKNVQYRVSGFDDFIGYLRSSYVEVLTFYGDYFDTNTRELHRNKIITIVDRHKLISIVDNPSVLGNDGIYHAGWRIRPDNLWAMGPLDNLVGMQYRIDHIENLKADIFDLVAAPPLKIKGLVDDFKWGPFERIYVGDDGDVEVLAPEGNVLNANLELQNLMNQMEEMAGSPKEAAGFRTPGEKTMYEVQRLENAAARIFAIKITQFEEQILEPLLNTMLEMFKRKMDSVNIRLTDSELNAEVFRQITKEDISGTGRIKPMAARNFAERAERIQNLNNFFQSTVGMDQDIKVHFSSVGLAYLFEDLLDIEDYKVVTPYIRLTEQQEAAQLSNVGEENTAMAAMAPSGLTPDDSSQPFVPSA